MKFVVKADFPYPPPELIDVPAQKTMYGGKVIAADDRIYLFADRGSQRTGLIARGAVVHSKALAKTAGLARQTPRVDLTIRLDALSARLLAREQLCGFTEWSDGRPETELNFKLYRQGTNKVVGISDATAIYLDAFFK